MVKRNGKGNQEIESGSTKAAWPYQQEVGWKKRGKDVDEAMLEYYRVFSKKIRSLPPEPELSDFYHPSEVQKNGELLFFEVGTGVATYAIYKYLK